MAKCLRCDSEKVVSLGLCNPCYRRDLSSRKKKQECSKCNSSSVIVARGLCNACYKFERRRSRLGRYDTRSDEVARYICPACGECATNGTSLGLCRQCYLFWYNRSRATDTCKDCGETRRILCYGKCYSCSLSARARECSRCGNIRPINRTNPDLCRSCRMVVSGAGRIRDQRRRARMRELEHTLTAREWDILLMMTDSRCIYCGQQSDSLEQEHWIPVFPHGGGYTYENIVPACRSCNASKGTMTGEEYLEKIDITLVCDICEIKRIAMEIYGDGM